MRNTMITRMPVLRVVAGLGTLFMAFAALAHHSIALQFDMTNTISVEGAIVELEWRNPHAWLHIEVENDAGGLELWKVEFSSANSLIRRGWRPDDLPVGTVVKVHGLPARDGSRSVDGEEIILPDGRALLTGARPGEQ